MVRISKHITYKEATRSATALRLGIENVPNQYELQNMEMVAKHVFEPLREAVGSPIKINSFFRCEELSNAFMYYYIKDNLDFDQLIWEFGTDHNPDWVHVSYVDGDSNRKRCLKAVRENGKTKYIDITNG
jgi:zinc D-Ala-D-Ala carboxypeptidase